MKLSISMTRRETILGWVYLLISLFVLPVVLYLINGVLTLQEIVYLDSRSLMKILNHCLQLRFEVVVEVSEAEQLEKLFSKAEVKHKGNLMVRVNQKDLFQRLYGFKHQSVQQAMETDKPLWYNETH